MLSERNTLERAGQLLYMHDVNYKVSLWRAHVGTKSLLSVNIFGPKMFIKMCQPVGLNFQESYAIKSVHYLEITFQLI